MTIARYLPRELRREALGDPKSAQHPDACRREYALRRLHPLGRARRAGRGRRQKRARQSCGEASERQRGRAAASTRRPDRRARAARASPRRRCKSHEPTAETSARIYLLAPRRGRGLRRHEHHAAVGLGVVGTPATWTRSRDAVPLALGADRAAYRRLCRPALLSFRRSRALHGRRLNMDVPISLAIILAAGMSL